jgi:phage tail sheath protein FI
MPPTGADPGVYIEEIPAGVHTIAGVNTSVAAFIGWAPQGNATEATRVAGWADFERHFGGTDPRSFLGYAVRHFFSNGGQDAYVVRLADRGDVSGKVTLGSLTFTARSPGSWSSSYAIASKRQADNPARFLITVLTVNKDGEERPFEQFDNLSMSTSDPRNAVKVINAASAIISVSARGRSVPADTPPSSPRVKGGDDGRVLIPNDPDFESAMEAALPQLARVDLFNLLCVPGETTPAKVVTLQKFCQDHRAFLITDCAQNATRDSVDDDLGILGGDGGENAAIYFPWVVALDGADESRPKSYPPCGFVAGIYARTDMNRGVWKAPSGTDATVVGATGLTISLTDAENGALNRQGINCLRTFPVSGAVVWGARTLRGSDGAGSDWKYVPVRRTALFIEESINRGTKWAVFEPNDEALWSRIRLNAGAFMHGLFRQGAFQGTTPHEAYFIKCDTETNPPGDIARGIVNIIVGFAPVKPAEFVVIKLEQIAGQIPP